MSGPQVVQGCVEVVHHLFQALLATEVGGTERVREIVVGMAGVEGRDQVGERTATGYLAKRAKGTCAGKIE